MICFNTVEAERLAQTVQRLKTRFASAPKAQPAVLRDEAGIVRVEGERPEQEALALAEAGIQFEIVPGVSSPVAAAAYAGIPMTHRDVSSSVTFITGSDREGRAWSPDAWHRLATATDTICVLMGMRRIGEIATAMLSGGRSPETSTTVLPYSSTRASAAISRMAAANFALFSTSTSPFSFSVRPLDTRSTMRRIMSYRPRTNGMRRMKPLTSAAVDLTRRKLNWRPDGSYQLLSESVNRAWDFGRGPAESVSQLRQILALDPKMKLLVGHGLFDLATPYFASKVLLDQARDADILVVGARGHGGFAGLLLGSVANAVINQILIGARLCARPRAPSAPGRRNARLR